MNTDRPECDITKTAEMVDLFQIPQDQRDEQWMESFGDTIQTASFACGNPQILTGPDGFPYFILRTPEANQPFESFCIRNLKDDFLLEQGFGVVVNPTENAADWVFSYGDILNLQLNNIFYSKADLIDLDEQADRGTEILIAQPSESYLPKQTKEILKKFLQSTGIAHPKMMLVSRSIHGVMSQSLVFNVYMEDFPDRAQFEFRRQQISWFLPRHYIILTIPKSSDLTKDLTDL